MEESTLRWPTDKEREEMEEVCSIASKHMHNFSPHLSCIATALSTPVWSTAPRRLSFEPVSLSFFGNLNFRRLARSNSYFEILSVTSMYSVSFKQVNFDQNRPTVFLSNSIELTNTTMTCENVISATVP